MICQTGRTTFIHLKSSKFEMLYMSNIVKPYQALPSLHSADHPPLPAGASSANLGFQHDSAEDAADELAHELLGEYCTGVA